jgi:hypothetical protein
MKIFITLLVFLISFYCNATVRLLNNNSPTPGQYSTYSAAESASGSGDTIYVSGSPTSYGNITMLKSVKIIGTGHNPDKQNPLLSTFGTITITIAGSNIIGCVTGAITFNNPSLTISNVSIIRNSISGPVSSGSSLSGSVLIEGNVFTATGVNLQFGSTFNGTIQNNILNGTIASLTSFNVFNNLFLANGVSVFSSVTNTAIMNNIFYRASPTGQNINCSTGANIAWPVANTFSGDNDFNNIVADPMFVNFLAAGDMFRYNYDFHLQAGSPGITNPGVDGNQRGVYGGGGSVSPTIGNSIAFTMTGEPAIPQMRQVNVTPTTVPAGQSINVNIISTIKQ